MSSSRLGILATLVVIAFIALTARLFHVQLVQGDPDRVRTDIGRLQSEKASVPAIRGAIFDRDGRVLRASRDAVMIGVVPSRFREHSIADCIADLRVLLDSYAPGRAEGAAWRKRCLDEALRDPYRAAQAVLALRLDVLRLEPAVSTATLAGPMECLVEPEGTLILTTADGRARIVDAATSIVPRGRPLTTKATRRRLLVSPTLGEALELTPAALAEDLHAEERLLDRLAAALGLVDAHGLRDRITARCDAQWQTVVGLALDSRLNDAICLQELGHRTPSAKAMGTEAYAAFVHTAMPGFARTAAAGKAVAHTTAILQGILPDSTDDDGALAPGVELEESDEVSALEVASEWKLVDPMPAAAIGAFCSAIRSKSDFETARRDAYQDARKRQQTVGDLRNDRTHRIGRAPDFGLADLIEGPVGLRSLGFRVEPEFLRDHTRAAKGDSLMLLLGAVTESGSPVGRGVETFANDMLTGAPGSILIHHKGSAEVARPVSHGSDVTLSLSLPLQTKIERLLPRPGAIAVVDIATGGILAATTSPAPRGDDPVDELAALASLEGRLSMARAAARHGDREMRTEARALREQILASSAMHRAVASAGQTPPGSVFKVLTLLLALERGGARPEDVLDCQLGPRSSFGCHHHGPLDLWGAIEKSCNHYCYEAALKLSPTKDASTAMLVAFYRQMGLFDAVPGLIGNSEGAAFERLLKRRPDDPRNDAIGQGSLTFAPIRVAGIAASLASGRVVHPWFAKTEGHIALGKPFASESNLVIVREGMRRVCETSSGTAGKQYRSKLTPLHVAGKTGTAQLSSGENPLYASWLVGYAPHDRPKYAFAVMFDRYQGDGADCSPVAIQVINACYDVLGGRP